MQKVTPCLWFDGQAEAAVNFYISVFRNSRIKQVTHYGDLGPGPAGGVMTIVFELDGQEFMALNGGPEFKFTEAISLMVNCETQEELDAMWEKLTADGGQEVECGWLRDKFGLSWQIVPTVLGDLVSDANPAKAQNVMAALLQMRKLDIEELRKAYARV